MIPSLVTGNSVWQIYPLKTIRIFLFSHIIENFSLFYFVITYILPTTKLAFLWKYEIITKYLIITVFGIHVTACIYTALGLSSNGWLSRFDYENYYTRVYWLYLLSLYFIVQTVCTVGYGDFNPWSSGEIVFLMTVQLVGIALYSVLTGGILVNMDSLPNYYSLKEKRSIAIEEFLFKVGK